MQLLQLSALQPMQVLPKNADMAGGGFQDSDQNIQESTLAASAPTQDDECLFWKDFEADSIENRPPVWKTLGQIAHLQDRLARLWPRRLRPARLRSPSPRGPSSNS